MKIVITGGHVTPALALIEKLQAMADVQIYFLGRKTAFEGDKAVSFEYQLITQRGIPFLNVVTGRLQRRLSRYTLWSLAKIPVGFASAVWHLWRIWPDVVCSFGGYLSVPVCFWSWVLGIPVITHEQTTQAGLANRVNSFFANVVAISYDSSARFFPRRKVVLTGNPVRQSLFRDAPRAKDLEQFFRENHDVPLVYITGGNQGSHAINQMLFAIMPQLTKSVAVVHQCGTQSATGDFSRAQSQKESLPKELASRYFPVALVLDEDIGAVFHHARVVVSRAGANIVAELALLGKRSILIPLPSASGQEQQHNAALLGQAGCARIILEKDLTPTLLLEAIRQDSKLPQNDCAARMSHLVVPDAAGRLARVVRQLGNKS